MCVLWPKETATLGVSIKAAKGHLAGVIFPNRFFVEKEDDLISHLNM